MSYSMKLIKIIVMRCVVVTASVYLFGRAHSTWMTDQSIDAENKTPSELIRLLGPPAKIVCKQKVPAHKGYVQEYRYFIVDHFGEVQYRSYIYDGDKWLTQVYPIPSNNKSNYFKIINSKNQRYHDQIVTLRQIFPDWRQKPSASNSTSR